MNTTAKPRTLIKKWTIIELAGDSHGWNVTCADGSCFRVVTSAGEALDVVKTEDMKDSERGFIIVSSVEWTAYSRTGKAAMHIITAYNHNKKAGK